VAGAGFAACSSSSSGGGNGGLSLTNVTVFSAKSATASPLWIAQEKGYFRQQGLNVTIKLGALSGSDLASALVGGSAQFIVTIPSSAVLAAQKGAPIRAVAMTAAPEVIDLSIRNDVAQAHHIPAGGDSAADTLAQISALKGSHLNLTTGAAQTDPNIALTYLLKKQGLTIGDGGDVKIATYDQTPLQVAAVRSHKADGIASFPPYTIIPNTMTIHLSTVDPLTQAAGYYMSTSASMLKSHSDTVQAMLTAMTQAMKYVTDNGDDARSIVIKQLKGIGIADEAEDETLFGYYKQSVNTYPSQSAFTATAGLLKNVQPVTIGYTTFVDPTFARAAYKKLGIAVPAD
jgi:ABC-type nitrate/sulfonate/bicarbonate transport system substrate-binding protein